MNFITGKLISRKFTFVPVGIIFFSYNRNAPLNSAAIYTEYRFLRYTAQVLYIGDVL